MQIMIWLLVLAQVMFCDFFLFFFLVKSTGVCFFFCSNELVGNLLKRGITVEGRNKDNGI